MGYDGWVTVGTKLDTKQLEKDLKNAERRLKQYEREAEKLTKAKAKAEIDLKPYEEERRLIQQITNEANQYAQTEEEVINNLNVEQSQMSELNIKYQKQLKAINDINTQIQENAKNQGLVTNEIEETNQKLNKAKGVGGIQDIMENVNKSTSSAIKKVGRWALAVFGVRSAYLFVRQAISTLSQYNEQMATDLEYIRYAIASSLQPLIEGLISLAYKLLTYVNYIAQAWFGVDLFANASADAMKRGAQSAEKMKKSLAGFDEMNVLNDNGTTGAMGGLPSVDLSAPEDSPPPLWIQFIAQNKDLIISALTGIAAGLLSVKFGLDAIAGTGVFLFVTGLVNGILELIEYFSHLDTSLENNGNSFQKFGNIIVWVGLAISGLALMIMSLPLAIGAAITIILGVLIGMWDEIKSGFQTLIDWISTDVMDWLYEHFGWLGLSIGGIFQSMVEMVMHVFDGLFTGIKQIFDGILLIFKGNFKQGFINIAKGIVNVVVGVLNGLISGLNATISPIRALIVAVGKVMGKSWTMENIKIPTIPKLAVGGIVNMPGRGIMYGGANIAERGAEGVIPLTNSQMMAQLGEAIGRYVTINANITNTMNGRIISRELQKINNNSDFAFNR